MTPYAKTGGLADVVGALAPELAALGHQVTCCLPFYRSVRASLPAVRATGISLAIPMGSQTVRAEVLEAVLPQGVRLLLINREEYFDRAELYHTGVRDYEDNAERFLFFAKAVAEVATRPDWRADVVHCHDWQTAFVPVQFRYQRQVHQGPVPPTVLTIHNLAYQGVFWGLDFPLTNLPEAFFGPAGLEFHGQLNLLKGGILAADQVTAVSPTYAREIQTLLGGFGLDGILRARTDRLVGILNGADYVTWDPATDNHLSARYRVDDLSGKERCRGDLLRRLGLDTKRRGPVLALISRLTELKGIDLVVEAAAAVVADGAALVMLGKGDRRYEQALWELANRFPRQVAVRVEMNEELAHQIQAGADMLLVPSRAEPCGLTQIYAMRYGTIPVVRAVGGLRDTVAPCDARARRGTGFRFETYTAAALHGALRRARAVFDEPRRWRALMRRAMAADFSWRQSALRYEKLYTALT